MPLYNKKLNPFARELRKKMTPQERHLWYDYLKNHPVKMYKQKVIGNYIVDFYCHCARLVIELDGNQHYEDDTREYDEIRTQYLNSMGISVVRFSNKDIDNNFEMVCQDINMRLICTTS